MVIKFPHYTEREKEALLQFMRQGIVHGQWQFEVRLVSKKVKWITKPEDPYYRMWLKNTAKRIDAVCIDAAHVHLIEVKEYLLPSGVGQLLLYRKMYLEQHKPKKPIKLWYVAYWPDPDVEELCKELGIEVWTVRRTL